ncbi:hypothetical protein BC936DRAFT_143241 [Jimgerdemannia flammicorona]|uniref:Uncharacterized protein n=1 Tax=Jimgerdemannia flammicorona TaxID=994334 RepID=A0A432ZZ93_9FUNG|nr:hypothetical protein BC936DRAFT_143241 [Jimgerdemannia flammicorona]
MSLPSQEVLATVLRNMKSAAESTLVEIATNASASAPGRQGRRLGHRPHVPAHLNEPLTAIVAYRLDMVDERRNVLVYDLGGGRGWMSRPLLSMTEFIVPWPRRVCQ